MESTAQQPPETRWRSVVAVIIVAQAIFLDAATARSAQAAILLELGLLLLISPPRRRLSFAMNASLLVIIAAACTAFLPYHWFPVPGWRARLNPYFESVLPGTVSPQPWQSAEALILLLAGCAWFYWCATAPLSSTARRFTVRLYVAAMILFASISLAFYARHYLPPLWYPNRGFGPFPNRNDNGNVLGIGALLSLVCTVSAFRRRDSTGSRTRASLAQGFGFAVGSIALLVALVFNLSRAAILMPFLGMICWMLLVFTHDRSWKLMSVIIAGLVAACLAVAIFGGEISSRFALSSGSSAASMLGLRREIQADALHCGLAAAFPGTGLRNFESLFPLYQNATRFSQSRVSHPESDWLWFWIEAGWLGLLATAGAVAIFFSTILPEIRRKRRGWEFGLVCAILLFLVHSFINPSGHALGAVFPVLLMAGLLINPSASDASWRLVSLFRVLALVLLATGTAWLLDEFELIHFPGSQTVSSAMKSVRHSIAANDLATAISKSTAGLKAAPLTWELYFARATARAGTGESFAALTDFQRAKALQPNRSDLPLHEGDIWASLVPAFALRAWGEALANFPADAPGNFRQILEHFSSSPQLIPGLRAFAQSDHRLTLIWLEKSNAEEFQAQLKNLFQHDPELADFTPEELLHLFELWSKAQSLHNVAEAISSHPAWRKIGWAFEAKDAAARGQFQDAYEFARKNLPAASYPPLLSDSSEELRRRYVVDPANSAVAFSLISRAKEAGDLETALHLARQAGGRKDAPRYFSALEAELAAAAQNWPLAWEGIARYGGLSSP